MDRRRDDGYEFTSDPDRLDLGLVHDWLSTDAYWALGRSRDTVDRSVADTSTASPSGLYKVRPV